MKSFLILLVSTLIGTTIAQAQIKNAKTATVKVYGNCGMCETTIEKAATKKNISIADWDEETNMATITYDSSKTNVDAVLKSIALAGYDNQSFLAPDAVYNKLHGCCKYDRVAKTEHLPKSGEGTMTSMNHQGHAGTSTSMNHQEHEGHNNNTMADAETNQLTTVFDSYFSLKDALVKTDGNLAAAKAKELQAALNSVAMNKLANDVHMVWMKVVNDLKKDAAGIATTSVAAQQRSHFIELSNNMYTLIKAAKPTEAVYYQHCPMANDGKGANWLSKESGIKNPYYGAKMLTCGSTVETIKQ